jgi:hypothetical protein
MKILYKPFGIIAGLIGARLARKLFGVLWGRIDPEAPPRPSTEDTSLPKVIGAAAFEAAVFAATRAAVDRASLKWFQFLTGIWAGEKNRKPTEE